ncbi:3-oxoacyl-ACP reductase FabG [bacterium]|nr:3-oxoacyl-ACP reductase FabG [bacterium]
MSNSDKTILVTGASGGIGRAIAVKAAASGYFVICHYNRGVERAQETLNLIKEAGGNGELLKFDVTNREECREILNKITEEKGPLWGIVSNAGITRDNVFAAMKGDEWDDVIRTDLDSFYNVIQPLVMPMARRSNKRGGRIIVISSITGIIGNRGQVNYSAAKAGIIGAAKALAMELASRRITVNCIAPGLIETDMIKGIIPEMYEKIVESIPMNRIGKPEEIASLALFLLSEESGYITKQVISVNGGME